MKAAIAGLSIAAFLLTLGVTTATPARADLCPYPFVGVAANVLVGHGGYCDGPTEINGSHMHCEGGGFGIGGVFGFGSADSGGGASVGGGFGGVGGASCTWRCPDGVMAPAPNPPGRWLQYMVPMNSTNFCRDHMTPNGFASQPVLPTEGEPPEGQPPPPPAPEPAPPSDMLIPALPLP